MKILYFIFSIVVIPPCLAINLDLLKDNLTVHLEVVDVDGNPIPGAKLELYFTHTGLQRQVSGDRTKVFKREFDGEEKVTIKYKSYKSIGIRAKKEEYWPSFMRYNFTQKDRTDRETDGSPNGHYQKEFTIVLRKKENPRPMFVHKSKYHATRTFNTPMGYDFEVGDLVEPFGTGKTTDLIFTLHQDKKEGKAYSHRLEMTFPQPEDGLIIINKEPGSESKLLLGAVAPENGYVPELNYTKGVEKRGWKFWVFQRPSKEELENVEGYWFRTRTEKNPENGEIKSRYGKINGPITFLVDELGGAFYFTYYFSPNQSRLLEWNGESLVPNANLQSVKKR
ncbi:hypothetical protein P3T73_01140 [Kiritimatiellota bacterium B12222]|nr:hypothetical protein P3T73_01140 [Kiritimatiellota bacterium B12222]